MYGISCFCTTTYDLPVQNHAANGEAHIEMHLSRQSVVAYNVPMAFWYVVLGIWLGPWFLGGDGPLTRTCQWPEGRTSFRSL